MLTATANRKGRRVRTLSLEDGRHLPYSGRVYPFIITNKGFTFMVTGHMTEESARATFNRTVNSGGFMIVKVS